MKSHCTIILLALFIFSCSTDDNEAEIACSLLTPVSNNLYINLVNTQGENLIENDSYQADGISINNLSNGTTSTNLVLENVEGLENFITLGAIGQDGDNTFEINLSSTETDILILNLTVERIGGDCPQTIYKLNTAVYNGEAQQVQDYGGEPLITVVKD